MNVPRPRSLEVETDDGVRLAARLWEPSSPKGTVVVVHGFSEHGGRYDLLAAALVDRGYATLAYDQRGHGRSQGRRGVLRDFGLLTSDLETVRTAAGGLVRAEGDPVLLGHSMGGLVVLRHLQGAVDPPPGAVLSAPWLGTALGVPAWKRASAALLVRLAPDLTLRTEIVPERLTRDPVRQAAYRDDPLVHHRMSSGFWYAIRDAQSRALEAGAPRCPTLVLLPGADPVTDTAVARRWVVKQGSDRLDVVELDERRHEPFNDLGRDEVFRRVGDWLDALPDPEPRPTDRVSSTNPPGPPTRRDPEAPSSEPSERAGP